MEVPELQRTSRVEGPQSVPQYTFPRELILRLLCPSLVIPTLWSCFPASLSHYSGTRVPSSNTCGCCKDTFGRADRGKTEALHVSPVDTNPGIPMSGKSE